MAPPSKRSIEVATTSLRQEAGTWDQESGQMGQVVGKAEALRLDRIEAGLFQIIVDAYRGVIDQVTARSKEGQRRMTEIGNTLHQVANTYDQEEQENVHHLKNLY
ncbi:MAG: hypothetical protein ACRDQ5_03890 [Sciscionella sp.]